MKKRFIIFVCILMSTLASAKEYRLWSKLPGCEWEVVLPLADLYFLFDFLTPELPTDYCLEFTLDSALSKVFFF